MIDSKIFAGILITLVIALAVWVVPGMASQDEEETIIGTVTAVDWDEDGNIVAVAISVTIESDDPDEEVYQIDYYVADTKKGNELINQVDKLVRATGKVEEDTDGNKTIYISEYEVIEEDEGL